MSCGLDTEANELLDSLTENENFDIPDIDLSSDDFKFPDGSELNKLVEPITVDKLTTKEVNGSGVFDILMTTFKTHLRAEYEAGRIVGAEYTKTYLALTEQAISQGVQFLLQKDAAFWQSQMAQLGAITARVNLETAKVQLAAEQIAAQTRKAEFGLTKAKIATESTNYCIAKFNHEFLLPQQLVMLKEQTETHRAQTSDTRTDGTTPIVGLLGKQKDLYSQQITSYQRDAEIKATKVFTDAWITMKSLDEGLEPPTNFANANLDVILGKIQENNELN